MQLQWSPFIFLYNFALCEKQSNRCLLLKPFQLISPCATAGFAHPAAYANATQCCVRKSHGLVSRG